MKESNMNRVTLLVLLCGLSAVQVVQAGETTMIPLKGEINARGVVDLVISVYDQPEGGILLYQLTKPVAVKHKIFDEDINVPSELFSANPQVFVGFAKTSAPEDEIGERMPFTKAPESHPIPQNHTGYVSLCFTCGGHFPFRVGAFPVPSPYRVVERGSGCSGSLIERRDTRPWLCSW
jgi:hypothetical protein